MNSTSPQFLFLMTLSWVVVMANRDNHWYTGEVDKNMFGVLMTENLTSNIHCGFLCNQSWLGCKAWYFDNATGECVLTKFFISPLYKPTTTNVTKFHTKILRDLAVGKVYTSVIHTPTKPPSRLSTGYHDMSEYCYNSKSPDATLINKWVMVDLEASYLVKSVKIFGPGREGLSINSDMVVKVSPNPPPSEGDFSTFTVFGAFDAVFLRGYRGVEHENGVQARYVVIEKPTNGIQIICFMQVFGEELD